MYEDREVDQEFLISDVVKLTSERHRQRCKLWEGIDDDEIVGDIFETTRRQQKGNYDDKTKRAGLEERTMRERGASVEQSATL